MTELKQKIVDLYKVEKDPNNIATILTDDGHTVTVEQIKDVLGVKKEPAPPDNKVENVGSVRKVISGSKAEYYDSPSLDSMKFSPQEQVSKSFDDLIKDVEQLRAEKNKIGKSGSRYTIIVNQLKRLKKRALI